MNSDKVLLAALKERTAASGTRYLSGWLGKARIVGFLDREAPGGETQWLIYAQTPDDRGERTGNGGGQQQQRQDQPNGRSGEPQRAGQQHRASTSRARQALPPGDLDDTIPF